jgi:hypothetical protein
MTGCFQWLALHITRMSRGNGLALFFLYYGLSSVLTIFTSNDVSIMALTVSTVTQPLCCVCRADCQCQHSCPARSAAAAAHPAQSQLSVVILAHSLQLPAPSPGPGRRMAPCLPC